MDATDMRILQLMGVQPFADWPRDIDHLKPAFIARSLKLAPGTVKARIRRLEKQGVIAGYEIYPNWSQLGLYEASYLFRCPDPVRKAQGLADLRVVEGIAGVESFLGADVGMEFLYRTHGDLERRVALVARLFGGATAISYIPYATLPVKTPLTPLDWKIVKALRHQPNARLPPIAKALKVSHRTVRRRLDRMWADGSIDTVARLDVGRVANHVFCNFLVRFEGERDPATAKRFFREFGPRWAYCWAPPDRRVANLIVGMAFQNAAEAGDMVRRMEAVPGVLTAEALVSVLRVHNDGWLDDAIEAKTREAEPRIPPTTVLPNPGSH